MKTLLALVGGIAIGFGIGAFVHRKPPPLADTSKLSNAHRADKDRLLLKEAEIASLNSRIASLEEKVARNDEAKETVATEFEDPSGKVRKFSIKGTRLGDGFAQNLREQSEKRRKDKIASRLATLTQRLGLTDAQAKSVRELLEKQMQPEDRFLDFLSFDSEGGELSVKIDEDTLKEQWKSGTLPGGTAETFDFDAALDAVLSEEQLESYATFQEAERENRIEIEASTELARLQSMVSLTPEQKDQAFAAFAEIARVDGDPKGPVPGLPFYQRNQKRVEALEGILSPEQLEVYRQTPQVLMYDATGGPVTKSVISIATEPITFDADVIATDAEPEAGNE